MAKTGAATALLVVWNPAERRLETIYARGTAAGKRSAWLRTRQSWFASRVLGSGRTLAEPIRAEGNPQLAAPAGVPPVTYAVGAGIRPPDGPRAALCVGLVAKPTQLDATIWTVESYARIAAVCLRDETALGGLRAAARQDGLTGCLNYGATRSELEREIARSSRHQRSLGCCFIDLDGFKQVNEQHGHPHGSRVLAEVGRVLRTEVRIGDSVGRYGGDEFIVVLPDTDNEAALALAERLRTRICAATADGSREAINASIGVVQWLAGVTTDQLLMAADAALRRAKRLGGGTVVGTEGGTGVGTEGGTGVGTEGGTGVGKSTPRPGRAVASQGARAG